MATENNDNNQSWKLEDFVDSLVVELDKTREVAEKFGIRPQEGYGLTETSPATNVNLPDPQAAGNATMIPSSRHGSVGQLLPGLAIKLTDPASDESIPISQQGLIWRLS